MKKNLLFAPVIAAILLPTVLNAQTAVPDRMSYQGIITDASGNLVADAAPENHEVIFRIYDAPTGGNVVYSEKQVLTISNGEFSGLIGAGADLAAEAATGPSTLKVSDVFDGDQRYLGVTVAAGAAIASGDAEISPRQQMVGTGFAFRAKTAEVALSAQTVVNGAIGTNALASGISTEKLGGGVVSDSELASLDGVTSPIQTQITNLQAAINAKANASGPTFTSLTRIDRLGVNTPGVHGTALDVHGVGAGGGVNTANFSFLGGNNGASHIHYGTRGDWYIRSGKNNGFVNIQDGGGQVNIGTAGNAGAKLVVSGNGAYSLGFGGIRELDNYGGQHTQYYASASRNISIYASGGISSELFTAFSDARIKNVKARSNSEQDLKTLSGIEITDYTYKDSLFRGNRTQKKVIAQQVEKIFPQAVSLSKDSVPDIYKLTEMKDGWIQLETELKAGDRVRLVQEESEGTYDVLEVSETAFLTSLQSDADEIFVYGREVDDFRNVDYEAIAMLNVSATQEIFRRLQAKEKHIETLEARLAELEKRDQSRATQMASIEKLLKGGVQTVALSK